MPTSYSKKKKGRTKIQIIGTSPKNACTKCCKEVSKIKVEPLTQKIKAKIKQIKPKDFETGPDIKKELDVIFE